MRKKRLVEVKKEDPLLLQFKEDKDTFFIKVTCAPENVKRLTNGLTKAIHDHDKKSKIYVDVHFEVPKSDGENETHRELIMQCQKRICDKVEFNLMCLSKKPVTVSHFVMI